MPVNPAYVGRVYPPGPAYEVGREKIREFATAIGDANPAYHDVGAARALGYADLIAPPTFAFVIGIRLTEQLVADPEFGVDYSRVVHGEQRFAYRRPITAGDELTGTVTVESVRRAGPLELVTSRADMQTAAGELVCTTWSTLVVRGEPDEAPATPAGAV